MVTSDNAIKTDISSARNRFILLFLLPDIFLPSRFGGDGCLFRFLLAKPVQQAIPGKIEFRFILGFPYVSGLHLIIRILTAFQTGKCRYSRYYKILSLSVP